jgi:hypothetical protein
VKYLIGAMNFGLKLWESINEKDRETETERGQERERESSEDGQTESDSTAISSIDRE